MHVAPHMAPAHPAPPFRCCILCTEWQSKEGTQRLTMTQRSTVLQQAAQGRSVHEPDLQRLTASLSSLEVVPVARAVHTAAELRVRVILSPDKSRGASQGAGSAAGSISQFRVAQLASSSAPSTPSSRKLLSPGPGAYDIADPGPVSSRCSFGTSRQRPVTVCPAETGFASPGPVYNAKTDLLSTMSSPSGTKCVGGRDLTLITGGC